MPHLSSRLASNTSRSLYSRIGPDRLVASLPLPHALRLADPLPASGRVPCMCTAREASGYAGLPSPARRVLYRTAGGGNSVERGSIASRGRL